MSVKNHREFELDNGLLVALQETPTQTVSGRLRVWHGALNEDPGQEGIAHFLEHTLITGGSHRYDPEESDEIRGMFGSFNATTSLERTVVPVDMLAEDTQLFLEYVSDSVFNPRFDLSKVEEERQRVLRETADRKSSPTFKDRGAYSEAFFGKNSPHTYFVCGDEEVIGSASVHDLQRFHARGYHPNNMDLILVGGLPENIEELVEQNFGKFEPGDGRKIELPRNPQLYGPTVLHTRASDLFNQKNPDQSSAVLGMSLAAPTKADEENYAVHMLVRILGGDANSKLFKSVSQREGLAYSVEAEYEDTNNKGAIYVNAAIHSKRADEAIDTIFEEMSRMRTELVSQDSLERLKRISRYVIAKTFETNSGYANFIEAKLDGVFDLEEHLKKIEAVTPEKVREAAVRYLPQNRAEGKYVLLLRDPLKTWEGISLCVA